jgi:hypothetical protein
MLQASVVPYNIRVSAVFDPVQSPANYSAFTIWILDELAVNPLHAESVWLSLAMTMHSDVDRWDAAGQECPPEGPGLRGLPPLPVRWCTEEGCDRCQHGAGGYRFQHAGPWTPERITVGAFAAHCAGA